MAELRFKILGDDTDIRKKLANLAKLSEDSGSSFERAFKKHGQGSNSAQELIRKLATETSKAKDATNELGKAQSSANSQAAKQAQLEYMDALRQSRLEVQKQREEQAKLRVAYNEGRITQQQYRIESAKFSLEERKKAAALRAAKKEIADNSEYQKLNRALGNLRTQSKNVLAEMYQLERAGKKNTTAYKTLANEARGLVAQTNTLDAGLKKIDTSLGLHQRNVGNYGSALDAVSPQFARINSQMQMMGVNLTEIAGNKNAFKELGAGILAIGKNIGAFLISPIGLVITGLASLYALIRGNAGTVKEFNSGLLNVSKTTNISGDALNRLGDDIVDLSRKLQTVSTDKLLEYATVAGQLGVKGSQNILAFTEALAKLETASDITGEAGGAEIARLLTLVDGGVQSVGDFGDEIVMLGNNFAATESEILGNATAIAQNTGLYKIGRRDALAYATATKAVGLEAEVVGSAMFRTLAQIEKYSNGAKGSEKILSLLGKTQAELSKQFKQDSASVFNDLIAALNQVDREGGNVTDTLNQLGLNNVRDIRVLGTLASSGYGQLQEAMESVQKAAGSLDEEFDTASGKIENQARRIGIAWDNLVLSIENGTGVLGRAFNRIVDGAATLLEMLTKISTSTGIDELAARMTSNKTADIIRELNLTFDEGAKVLAKVSDETKRSQETYDELAETYARVKEQYDIYQKKVNEGVLTEEGKHNLQEYGRLLDSISNRYATYIVPTKPNAPKTEEPTVTVLTEAEIKAQKRMVESQRAMQAKIDEAIQQSKRRALKAHEEEVQAVRDKYAKIREEAIRFNKDPENKLKVDIGGLSAAEKREVNETIYKQETTLLKKELDEQLRLYNEFESFRKATSIKAAEERYKDQLPIIRGYETRLQKEIAQLATKDRTGEEEKRYQALLEDQRKFNDARRKEDNDAFIQAANTAATYSEKLEQIEKDYYENVTALGDKASKEQLDNLKKAKDRAISELSANELMSGSEWEQLFSNLDSMTLGQIDTLIREIEDKFNDLSVKFDPIDLSAVRDQLDRARREMIDRNPFATIGKAMKAAFNEGAESGKKSAEEIQADWRFLANSTEGAFDFVQDAIGQAAFLEDALGEVGNTALQSLMSVAAVSISVASAIKTAEKASVILAVVQAALVVVQSIANMFQSIFNRHDKRIDKSISGHRQSVEELERAYIRLQRAVESSLGAASRNAQRQQISNLREQKKAIEEMIRLEEDKKRTDRDKVNEYKNELENIDHQIADINQAISESLLGTNYRDFSNALTDAIVSAFEQGESAIDAMNDTFDNFIKNALTKSLLLSRISPIIDEMMARAAEYATANNDSLLGFNFETYRRQIEAQTKVGLDQLDTALKGMGIDISDQESGGGGLSKGIAGITADQAGRLEGEFGGLRLAQLQLLEVTKMQTGIMQEHSNYAFENLQNALKIERNTFRTAENTQQLSRLASIETAIVSLNNKVSNTDALARGAGFS